MTMAMFVKVVVLLAFAGIGLSGNVELSQMLEDIGSDPIEIKKHFTGPNLHPYNSQNKSLGIHYKCVPLYQSLLDNANPTVLWPPPKEIPLELLSAYTFNHTIAVLPWWLAERQNGGAGYHWAKEQIEDMGKSENTCGVYNLPHCGITVDKYKHFIKDKVGMVFGSLSPWAEASLLVAGEAKHITTVEYMSITTTHEKLSAYHPLAIAERYVKAGHSKEDILVDFAFSFSSFEHDGLGRYGDPLNPYGDLEAIGGILFLGLPVGPDAVVWNAHRIYGRHRLRVILANWEIVDLIGALYRVNEESKMGDYQSQPMWVLRKKQMTSHPHQI